MTTQAGRLAAFSSDSTQHTLPLSARSPGSPPQPAACKYLLTMRAHRGEGLKWKMRQRNARHEQRAIAGGKLSAKGPAETATDQEPVKTAEVHRIYPVAPAADPRLVELLKLVEELRADREDLRRDR